MGLGCGLGRRGKEPESVQTAEQAELLLIERGGEEEAPHIAEPGKELRAYGGEGQQRPVS